MFTLTNLHPDWYEDGIEEGEQCWRMDPNNDIQVQLFARPVEDNGKDRYDGPYEPLRLFIERDSRDPDSNCEIRVYYACKDYPLTDVDAVTLLGMSNEQVLVMLEDQIKEVMALPNRPEYCPQS